MQTLTKDILRTSNGKINVNNVRIWQAGIPEEKVPRFLDILKRYETNLLKILPLERCDRVVKLFHAILIPNSTSEEIESALVNALYSEKYFFKNSNQKHINE